MILVILLISCLTLFTIIFICFLLVNSIVFNILIDDLQSSLIFMSFILCHKICWKNLPSVRQCANITAHVWASRAHDQDILWFEVAMNYLSDLSGKVSTSSPEAPDAQGQHADANSWPSLSRGPCGNAYMQFLRVYAWIRASDDSHRRKHIRSTNVIHVSAKVLNINDVNDVNDINVKVREAVRIDFEPTT